jgi:redox-sensitive bicupin YhaK (pirin superfamily)
MSVRKCHEPQCLEGTREVKLLVRSRERDLGGFSVRRVLPNAKRRMVGPYIFFDHMGPSRFAVGEGIDVRPHPHIGISTVTWLFDGEIMHRDSLASVQPIRPGAVNFMTAGSGIVHSERTGPQERAKGAALHGIQLWLALPAELQETAPAFTHYPADSIPATEVGAVKVSVIVGEAFGLVSPVATPWPTLYGEALFAGASDLRLPDGYEERALYVVDGSVGIGDQTVAAGEMAVLRAGAAPVVRAEGPARAMLLGGAAYPEQRTIWWNFVSTSPERIEQAKQDWAQGRFARVPGDDEFIPLPE